MSHSFQRSLADHPTHADPLTAAEIKEALKQCAKDTLGSLVAHRMRVTFTPLSPSA